MSVCILDQNEYEPMARHFFGSPHQFLDEDVAYARDQGLSEADMLGIFKTAKRLAVVYDHETPIYMFGCAADDTLITLSAAALKGRQITLAKHVARFIRTPEGRDFFVGVVGRTHASDIESYGFLHRWAKSLGFKQYAEEVETDGDTTLYYSRS